MSKIRPQQRIVLTFLTLILIGSLLLFLPFARNNGVTFLDSLFTSTSAVTITGLSTTSIKDGYTIFGKIVIALLIQLGGLSITTISIFFLTIIGAKITFRDRDLVKENINVNTREGIVKTIKRIITITFIIESIAVILLFSFFMIKGYSFGNSLGYALFHTISAYNNAGFTIFDNDSLMLFSNDYFFTILSFLLIVLGGIGSIVIYDLWHNRRWKKLKYHTKIVLKMTLILLVVSSMLFFVFEENATILQSLFHASTIRTAGFYSYNYLNAKNITLFLTIIFMYIGGAPGSNSGGIKVTTVYTLFKTTKSKLTNKTPIAYKKKISNEFDSKSHLIITLSLFVTILSTLIIIGVESDKEFLPILFEVFSAFSNTGLSLNITPVLSVLSKIVIIVVMFIGRVGVISFFVSLTKINTHFESIDYIDIDYLI